MKKPSMAAANAPRMPDGSIVERQTGTYDKVGHQHAQKTTDRHSARAAGQKRVGGSIWWCWRLHRRADQLLLSQVLETLRCVRIHPDQRSVGGVPLLGVLVQVHDCRQPHSHRRSISSSDATAADVPRRRWIFLGEIGGSLVRVGHTGCEADAIATMRASVYQAHP